MKTETTKNAIYGKLENYLKVVTVKEEGKEDKTRGAYEALKSKDFTAVSANSRDAFRRYCNATNGILAAVVENQHGEGTKTAVRNAMQTATNFISAAFPGGEAPVIASYHVNFVLDHARALKLSVKDGKVDVSDVLRAETSIRRLFELCLHFIVTGKELPGIVMSEKSKKRVDKLAGDIAKADSDAAKLAALEAEALAKKEAEDKARAEAEAVEAAKTSAANTGKGKAKKAA